MSENSGCRYNNEGVKLNVLYIVGCISIFSYVHSQRLQKFAVFLDVLLVAVLACSELVHLWHCALQKYC